jgi:hypothetical protein
VEQHKKAREKFGQKCMHEWSMSIFLFKSFNVEKSIE